MQMKACGFLLVEELETTFQLNHTRFLDKRRLHWAFQAESTFFNKSRVFQEYGGINEDWMNEWVSHQGITAGWPSALLWHKQKGLVSLLSAEGTPPHIFTERASLAPYRWYLVLFFGIYLFRDNFLTFRDNFFQPPVTVKMWHNADDLLDATGLLLNGETRSLWQIRWIPDIYLQCDSQWGTVRALNNFSSTKISLVQFQTSDNIILGLQPMISLIINYYANYLLDKSIIMSELKVT